MLLMKQKQLLVNEWHISVLHLEL